MAATEESERVRQIKLQLARSRARTQSGNIQRELRGRAGAAGGRIVGGFLGSLFFGIGGPFGALVGGFAGKKAAQSTVGKWLSIALAFVILIVGLMFILIIFGGIMLIFQHCQESTLCSWVAWWNS